jgi:hypothetical protein
MTQEELDQLAKTIVAGLEKRDAPRGPRRINRHDTEAVNENLRDIAKGTAILVDDSDTQKRRQLRPHEVDRWDPKAISANLSELASGEKILADPFLPE